MKPPLLKAKNIMERMPGVFTLPLSRLWLSRASFHAPLQLFLDRKHISNANSKANFERFYVEKHNAHLPGKEIFGKFG